MGYGPETAGFYDRLWRHAEQVAPDVLACVEAIAPPGRRLLDLCCGTGDSSRAFVEAGWSVTGVDLSPDMIGYAIRRPGAERARYLIGDATALDLPSDEPYTAVICLYDSLNHLPDLAAVTAAFDGAARVAAPGAVFLFDLNTAAGLRGWDREHVLDDAVGTMVVRGTYDHAAGEGRLFCFGYVREDDGRYRRFSEEFVEQAYSSAAIADALTASGWNLVHTTTYADLTQHADADTVRRAVYVATRGDA